jgi:hypothetical protein
MIYWTLYLIGFLVCLTNSLLQIEMNYLELMHARAREDKARAKRNIKRHHRDVCLTIVWPYLLARMVYHCIMSLKSS